MFDRAPKDLKAIAAGAVLGDSASILFLYDRFGPLVNRLVWRLVGADDEHNDVVQDVFVSVIESIGRVKSPELLEQWISSVTVNTVRRLIKKRRFYRIFHLAPDPGRGHAVPSDPDAIVELRFFYETLDRMPADDRLVFTLRFVDGRRLEEVGAICNCSLAAAKRRLNRACDVYFRLGGEALSPRLGKGHEDE